ncbi:anti-phage dCTP deaminase [Tunturibacter empetritectus]|uniref:Anti-phage dCTP deaminase n=1 Tax=Tunturiibacter empetritectus TaxID=3069691 RepID=A0AAU7Z8F4_9BACT
MSEKTFSTETNNKNAELVFGLVAPIGTDANQVAENLSSQLREFRYQSELLRLSDFIEPFSETLGLNPDLEFVNEYERIDKRIKAANEMYREFNANVKTEESNALLALAAIDHISSVRKKDAPDDALLDRAHILVTLKRPQEVNYLRKVYGIGLHIIGVFATEEDRVKHLHRRGVMSLEQASSLVKTDEDDKQDGGQRTGDAFHLSDLFLDVGGNSDDWKHQLGRFLDLLFSHPYKTPTRDEQAMFMAHAASLRSAQFGRQVGAAIASEDGDVIAMGCNEVPKAGGGQYWDKDDGDERDHVKGHDSNDLRKNTMLQEVLSILPESLQSDEAISEKLRKTSLFSITEFGRAVHAEMEAILSCARKGISTVGKTLYTTTFPCHNCARHIVGAGIKKVVYIEPYPKSKAKELHDDAIILAGLGVTV